MHDHRVEPRYSARRRGPYTAIVFFTDHLTSPVTLSARGARLNGFHASLDVGTTSMLQADGVGYVNSLSGTYWFDREGGDD